MKLPNFERAVVAEAKIVKYLLNKEHPSGKHKAAFFTRFGFSVAQWQILAEALLIHEAAHEVADTLETAEGTHYTVEGELKTPDERNPSIRSVWTIDKDSEIPRFITAYPLKKSKEK